MTEAHRIFNMDEKGCRLTIHHQQKVLSKRGVKRVHMVAHEDAENVTVVACGNAVGQAVPPKILFKGKRKKSDWLDSMPPGTAIEMTRKGSMTEQTFVISLEHFSKYKPPGLLIFDGASSYLDANVVTAADVDDITLFCLPIIQRLSCSH
ncbi:DDE superfamily endonuclease [Popillia japonica]|uniref:DDE superfamily endonuclease n=1 Tax=Popillia japonica TaxID=7064 RepID=A0AAW1N0Y2_POPJA